MGDERVFYTLNNRTLTVNLDFTQSEFIAHCVGLIDYDGIENIEKCIIATINYYFIKTLNEVEYFSNVIFLSSRREPLAETRPFYDLSDYINDGSLSILFYKFQLDCVLNSGILEIKLVLPSFIKAGDWFSLLKYFNTKNESDLETDKKYFKTKKKTMRTKERINFEILALGFDFSFLKQFQNALPEKDKFIEMSLLKGLVYVDSDGTKISKEDLPFPIVVYPEWGDFITFKLDIDSEPYYCSCSREDIANYNKHPYTEQRSAQIKNPHFKDSLCHECNKKVPHTTYYGLGTYGTTFSRHFGWYIGKRRYSKGKTYLIKDDIEEIENEVRSIFGFRKIGEEWVGETISYYKIKEAFSETEVIHHGKPYWLGLQHLDIWMPEYNVAVEYQGEQHDKEIDYFGGKEALAKNQERDKRKLDLCIANNTKLFYAYSVEDIDSIIVEVKAMLNE